MVIDWGEIFKRLGDYSVYTCIVVDSLAVLQYSIGHVTCRTRTMCETENVTVSQKLTGNPQQRLETGARGGRRSHRRESEAAQRVREVVRVNEPTKRKTPYKRLPHNLQTPIFNIQPSLIHSSTRPPSLNKPNRSKSKKQKGEKKMMCRCATLMLAALLLVLQATATFAQGPLPQSVGDDIRDLTLSDPFDTILEYLRLSDDHQVLLRLLPQDGLDTPLGDVNQRLTLIAPTNGAFATLARRLTQNEIDIDHSDVEQILLALREGLDFIAAPGPRSTKSILSYHVIEDALPYQRLELRGDVTTLSGAALTFEDNRILDRDSKEDSSTILRNVLNQNGWLHSVNSVLLPFDLDSLLEALNNPEPTPSTSAVVPPVVPTGPTITPAFASPLATPVEAEEDPEMSASPDASDEEEEEDDGVCFPASSMVHLADGTTQRMDELVSGTQVRHDQDGNASPIFLFTHRARMTRARFVQLHTSCVHVVTLTPSHYVHANGRLTAARAVHVGDTLRTVDGVCTVVDVRKVHGVGLYAPHSVHGDLVVDGVVVSGYSQAVAPLVAHALLLPVRWLVRLTGVREPLGGMFYNGADWALRLMPKGSHEY